MRPAWLNLLLVLSLAANVVEVAIPFWNHYRWLRMALRTLGDFAALVHFLAARK